jgi:hypothetical protein
MAKQLPAVRVWFYYKDMSKKIDIFLDVQSAHKGIQDTDDAVLYVCGYEDVDLFFGGDMTTLLNSMIEAMKMNDILREVVSEAVYYLDDEEADLSLN